jgi:hypothetical protein
VESAVIIQQVEPRKEEHQRDTLKDTSDIIKKDIQKKDIQKKENKLVKVFKKIKQAH